MVHNLANFILSLLFNLVKYYDVFFSIGPLHLTYNVPFSRYEIANETYVNEINDKIFTANEKYKIYKMITSFTNMSL